MGGIRLILVLIYKGGEACGDPDRRPAVLNLHYMYFAILLFWLTFFVTVIVSCHSDSVMSQ